MIRLVTCAMLVIVAALVVGTMQEIRSKAHADDQSFTIPRKNLVVFAADESPRQQLLERLKAKVELMSDDDVQTALESTERDIRVLQAQQKLDATVESLRSITREFDGTPAASVARDMLAVHERGPAPDPGDAPFYGPGPTPAARPVPDYGSP